MPNPKQPQMIAMCDILGFSNLVRDNPLDNVIDHSLGFFRKALNHSLHRGTFPETPPPTTALNHHELVGVT